MIQSVGQLHAATGNELRVRSGLHEPIIAPAGPKNRAKQTHVSIIWVEMTKNLNFYMLYGHHYVNLSKIKACNRTF